METPVEETEAPGAMPEHTEGVPVEGEPVVADPEAEEKTEGEEEVAA